MLVSGDSYPLIYSIDVLLSAVCLYPAARRGVASLVAGTISAAIVFVGVMASSGDDPASIVRIAAWSLCMTAGLIVGLIWGRVRI